MTFRLVTIAIKMFVVLASISIEAPVLAETSRSSGHQVDRAAMLRTIETHAGQLSDILGQEGIDNKVLDVMGMVERHRFVPPSHQEIAYADRPVRIGFGQTISQPFIVAMMTDLLDTEPDDVVLEIGTGSGYQAAILAHLVRDVCTIEIVPELGEQARTLLQELGYDNARVRVADGYHGWPECGPFDGIIVTAAADHVPRPLLDQLKPGGRMVIPVGGVFSVQYLTLVTKTAEGQVKASQLLPVRFVPFTRAR
jgi:protein-L-isoaspartate(D-aspartate) O-methyltransferase